jgi:hypothetical protein
MMTMWSDLDKVTVRLTIGMLTAGWPNWEHPLSFTSWFGVFLTGRAFGQWLPLFYPFRVFHLILCKWPKIK